MKAGTGNWVEAQAGMCLEHGDIIRSGDDSGAEVTFLDGGSIELEAGTEIEVVSLDISTDTDSATIVLKQTIGSIIFRVTKIIDPASRYEVETPAGAVAIRGSAAEIHVMEDGTTWACNLEGDIWAVAEGVELEIPEGRCCIIRPGHPPELAWKLAISTTSGGEVTTPGEGSFAYEEGTVINLVAEPDEGYHFINWSGDVDTMGNANAASTTIAMNDNYSIRANFEEGAGPYYTLTIWTTGGGSTNPPDGEHTYSGGTVVHITAIPAVGYRFVKWTRDVDTIADVNAATTTITVNDNYSIQANFIAIAPLQYSLSTSSTENGYVSSPCECTTYHYAGDIVNLVAVPYPEGEHEFASFVTWTGNVGTIDNIYAASTHIHMNGDYSITAVFQGYG